MRYGSRARMALAAGALALATLLLGTSVVQAGENKGKISLSGGVDFTTAYFFRGILQEKDGFIAQPYADITFNLYEGSNGVNSIGATLGIWNSIQSESPGTPVDPIGWYEADFYGGVTFGLFDKWEAGATYTIYTSPNGVFKSTQEIAFSLAYDDSDLLGAFALSPNIVFAIEVQGGGATGPDLGTYFALNVEPSFTVIESEKYPVTLSIPLTVGLSLGDYYENPTTGQDSTFGYFDAGVKLSMPLGFIPADYGSWEVYIKGDFLFLGSSTEAINGGEDFEAIGTIGVALAY
jgi:hypothetical protein